MSDATATTIPAALARRLAETLRARVSRGAPGDAVADTGVGSLMRGCGAHALAEAAHDALRAALDAGDDRRGAFDLLVADALLTAACETAALEELPQALDAARFATLLEER